MVLKCRLWRKQQKSSKSNGNGFWQRMAGRFRRRTNNERTNNGRYAFITNDIMNEQWIWFGRVQGLGEHRILTEMVKWPSKGRRWPGSQDKTREMVYLWNWQKGGLMTICRMTETDGDWKLENAEESCRPICYTYASWNIGREKVSDIYGRRVYGRL